jgi:hypothetical protein
MANSYKRLGYTGAGAGGGSGFVKDPVATLPALPSLGNTASDLRYVNSVDQWYQWNGSSWESWTTYLTSNMVLVTNGVKQPISSGITATELGYLTGVTSNIQGQIDALGSFSATFNESGDWLGPFGGYYTISFSQASHQKDDPIVEVFEVNGGVFSLVHTGIEVDGSINVIIAVSGSPDLRFAGKIIIS